MKIIIPFLELIIFVFMAYINYNNGSKVLFILFVIFGTLGFISFIGLIVYDVGLEKINDKIVQHRINKNKRERKLKNDFKS